MTIKLGSSLVAANSTTYAATNKKVFDHECNNMSYFWKLLCHFRAFVSPFQESKGQLH